MANSVLPEWVLLEDAADLTRFYEATWRTIPRGKWVPECAAVAAVAANEAVF
jgi:hypothetical protein